MDKKVIDEIVKDLQRALIQADVNVHLAKELGEKIRKEAENERSKTFKQLRKQHSAIESNINSFNNFLDSGIQKIIDSGFVDTFRTFTKGNGHYTWWSHFANARARNVGWRIDYIMASKSLKPKIKKAEIHADVMGSDHAPVSIQLAL